MVKVIAGLMGSSVASGSSRVATPEQLRSFLSMLDKHNVRELDTARVYNNGKSEECLGQIVDTVSANHFCVATKAPGFSPGSLAYDNVMRACKDSLAALKQPRLDLYYFHGPDRQTPLEESCRAINQLHQEGLFDRFGVSNFHVDEVTEIVNICRKNGWILPSVYQGGYNPLSRGMETDLLPALRKYGMAFYAYSPLGGGFFSRPIEQLRSPPAGGRMDQMKVFQMIYVNDLSLKLLQTLTETCDKEGLTVHESTLRWMMHHSLLQKEDGIILGGSSEEQMEQNLQACEGGSLPKTIVDCFEDMCQEYQGAGKGLAYSV
jgi:aflatoxin B1 aldehyde reductase